MHTIPDKRSSAPSLAFLCMLLAWAAQGPALTAQELGSGLFAAMEARSIGPAGMSGRITAIDAVEANPNIVFVGAATGGLWRSVNGGQTWDPVFDEQRILSVGAVAVFQPNPDLVWVGTGEGNPRNSAGVGAGVYKSLDGGRTWMFKGLEGSERIHRIVLDPTDPDIAYVGVMGPAWSDGEERGVYRTRDGGETWDRVLFVGPGTGVSDLVMDPSNPNKLLAGMWQFRRWPWFFESGGDGSGLYVTYDGGDSWKRLSPDDGLPAGQLGRIGLAIARNDPRVVYALVEARPSVLLRSDDGGESWRTVNNQPELAPRPFYYADIFVDPENELRLYNLNSRLTRSEDGGGSFEVPGGPVHPDAQALWIDPGDSRTLYLGTDGGVYISRDRGDHWRFVDNLPVGQFYHVSVDMAIPFNIYGGMQDNGSWRGPSDVWEAGGIGNQHWREVGSGDGFGTLIDPSDTTYGYAMRQAGGLVRFDLRTGERKDIRPWAPEGIALRFNWNAALAADPLAPGTIYLGSQFVHKSLDGGESWQIISGDLTSNDPEKQRQDESGGLTPDHTGAENYTTITSIAPSPVETEVIWVGSDDGRVHLTRSGGGEWEEVGRKIGGVPDGAWVAHIEASKHNGATAYVVFDDHQRGNWTPYIFRTEDYGRHWDDIADEDQIQGFVHTVEEDPLTPNLLFAGTEFGLYVSLNRGKDWFPWRSGLPPAPVRSLVIHPRDHDLVIGTHGRALYILDDIRPLRAIAQDPSVVDAPVHLFPLPPAYLHGLAAPNGSHFPGDAMFQGEPRTPGALITFSLGPSAPEGVATIRVRDEDGAVLRSMEGPARRGLNRLSWDLREDGRGGQAGESGAPERAGPDVLPGKYEIQVVVNGEEASGQVEVLPDPRRDIPPPQRIEKRDAVRRASSLDALFATAADRTQELARGLDRLTAALAGRQGEAALNASRLADSVRAELAQIEAALNATGWDRSTVASIASTRDAPTEGQRIALTRMGEALDRIVGRLNAVLSGEVGELRRAAQEAGIIGLPELRPVPRGGGDDRLPREDSDSKNLMTG